MTERDIVDHVVGLAARELSPSLEDKARHRAPLGLGPAAMGHAASGLATRAEGTTQRAGRVASGWRALRASGVAGWTTGALLLGAGVALGFWLRGALPDAATGAPAVAVTSVSSVVSPPAPAAPIAPFTPPADASMSDGRAERAAERSSDPVEATIAGARAVPPRARARAKLERRATGPAAAGDEKPFVPQPFDEELALLQRVERAIRANEYSLALALLTELDERFATTRLEEERRAARLIAECRLDLPGSHQRGEHFLEERPNSVYANRLQMACSTPR
jgi:hypothetical protein